MPVHFAVFGDFHAQQLIRNGALPEYVHKVGPVIFDDVIHYKSRPTKTVLIATAPLVEDNECTKKEYFSKVEKVLKDIAEISGISIVLKLHPREKYKNVEALGDGVRGGRCTHRPQAGTHHFGS